ncbi:MAG: TonB-dependent receptor [Saprospiraceae bacterium]|nr:TonB-dependent receptor [Saprospiraceae bacterium]
MIRNIYFILILFIWFNAHSQHTISDTIKTTSEEILIKSHKDFVKPVQRLHDVHGVFLISGKKNEVIDIVSIHANIAEKTGRQLFSKIPGAFIYDMDGSGNQMNISTRGLDPHRSWEYNIRQNGVITNTDIYGYPASHYNQPMESIRSIEMIRGTSALQYGAQFGGLINYNTKEAPKNKTVEFESINSIGSYGLLSTYNALGVTKGKWSIYGYYHKRTSSGYRENAQSDSNNQYVSVKYQVNDNLSLRTTFARSIYLYQLPGPLTDAMFLENPRQSTRNRNHYSPEIFIPTFEIDWKINESTILEARSSAIYGDRNSVLFVGFANSPDLMNPQTNQFNNRQVDIDNYNSWYNEIRLRKNYNVGKVKNILATGFTYINNDTHRRQQGKGTTGSDYDLTVEGDFGRDLHFKTNNIAFYAENMIALNPKWSLTPGVRYEYGKTEMTGFSRNIPDGVQETLDRNFFLLGISSQYKFNEKIKLYGGMSQAYRPVIFADLIPIDDLNKTDPNLKDASGFNADIGISGSYKYRIYFDISYFALNYENRIGNQLLNDASGSFLYKTNSGSTLTSGLESYIEGILFRSDNSKFSLFTSTSLFEGSYRKGNLVINGENRDITGNRQETLPAIITRNGFSGQFKQISGTLQYSYVSKTFADPANTILPSANGAIGEVPGYGLWDLNVTYIASGILNFRCGINNIADKQYFTKRPTTYPGGGIWPSDGRSFVFTVALKI